MADTDQDGVTPAESPAAPQEPVDTAQAPDDRPLKNIMAEFNRKFSKQQDQINAVLTYLASQTPQQQPAQMHVASRDGRTTKEELFARAQQGDQGAFEQYQKLIADECIYQAQARQSQTAIIERQLQAIMARYPVLGDPSHPLRQTVDTAYALLVQNGYPATRATLLDAAKTAIADRPDLVSELHQSGAQAREGARRTASQFAQSGVTEASHRSTPAAPASKVRISDREARMAKDMGITDPAKAKERFLQRQKDGQSNLGGIGAFVREEEL